MLNWKWQNRQLVSLLSCCCHHRCKISVKGESDQQREHNSDCHRPPSISVNCVFCMQYLTFITSHKGHNVLQKRGCSHRVVVSANQKAACSNSQRVVKPSKCVVNLWQLVVRSRNALPQYQKCPLHCKP